MEIFLSIFPPVFNALGCLQFCMCLVGGRLMKILVAPTRSSNRPSQVQLVRLDLSPGMLLLSLQKLSVKPAQCTRIRPNTNYLTCCLTLQWLSYINTHLPDSGNTWIVVYPLLGVNTHTRFHFSFLLCLCIFTAHMLSRAFYRFLDLFLKILFHLFILLNNKHGNYLLCLLHHEFLC